MQLLEEALIIVEKAVCKELRIGHICSFTVQSIIIFFRENTQLSTDQKADLPILKSSFLKILFLQDYGKKYRTCSMPYYRLRTGRIYGRNLCSKSEPEACVIPGDSTRWPADYYYRSRKLPWLPEWNPGTGYDGGF